jgi:soluble cytochrome b562
MAPKKNAPGENLIRQFHESARRGRAHKKAGPSQKELKTEFTRLIRERAYLIEKIPKLRDSGKLKDARASLKECEAISARLKRLARKIANAD